MWHKEIPVGACGAALNKRIKLLIASDEMEVGGTQRQISHFLKNVDQQLFEPHLLYFRHESYLLDELREAGVRIIHIPKDGRIDLVCLYSIIQLFWRERYDIIHCFSLTAEFWCGVAKLVSPKADFHTSIRARYDWFNFREWTQKRFVTRLSKSVVSNSLAGSEYALQKDSGMASKLKTIYNGVAVDHSDLEADTQSMLPDKNKATALFIGRLVEQKNLPCLLRALAFLKKSGTALQLIIVGSGGEDQPLKQLADEFELGDMVVWMGERKEAQALIRYADFVVLPSHSEGISNALLETMLNGRVIIASDIKGNAEIIEHGRNGFLFPPDNCLALATIMQQVISDRDLLDDVALAGQKDAETYFGVDVMTRKFMELYLSERAAENQV